MDSQSTHLQIRLNFLALQKQDFEFTIYRRACASAEERREQEGIYRYSFPVEEEEDIRADYWVSFEERENFQAYRATPLTNRRMAIRYLCFALAQNVASTLSTNEYDLEGVKFRQGLDVILATHPEGTERVWIEPTYLAPVGKLGFLVDFHFRRNQGIPFDRQVQRLSLSLNAQGLSNKNFYADKYRKLQEFRGLFGDRVFSAAFCSGLLTVDAQLESIDASTLNARRFVFADKKEYPVAFTGLVRFGPLTPLQKPLRFALIYAKTDRPLINELATGLMGRSNEVPFKGLSEVFRLRIGKSVIIEVPDLTVEATEGIVKELTREQTDDPNSILLPLVVMTKSDPDLYRKVKYDLLQAGFPVQVVSKEKISDRSTFKWAVADIALQLFSKAGGEPWRVVPTTDQCVIFGIGQAHDEDDDGNVRRYYSYLVCTDTTGIYRRTDILGTSDDEVTYLSSLREKILSVMKAELASGYTRCVLHVPFKIKHTELKAIEDAIADIRSEPENARTQFVVLRINTDSKYFGYADTTSLIPYESTYVRVSNSPRTYLVWFEGLLPGDPVVRKRPSGPVLIEFHWPQHELTEADEQQLLQDVLNLAACNWRGFNAKHLPISVFYCKLIAKHLRRFGDLNLQLDSLPGPWFL